MRGLAPSLSDEARIFGLSVSEFTMPFFPELQGVICRPAVQEASTRYLGWDMYYHGRDSGAW
jgi:hypothetical protein